MEELKYSDFEIVPGEPDITDWEVMNEQGEKIGDVDDVLFDPESRKVRYLIIDMEINTLMLDNPYQVLIPIGLAKIDEEEDKVILTDITEKQLNELPKYERGIVTPEYEMAIRNIIEENIAVDSVEQWKDFYEHDHFTESGFFRNHNDENRNEKIQRVSIN
ncbi:PRC-barrel domain-containing protein [Mucilaginibacter sp.]